ncbi:MAG: SDR family oxidoreductase [Acidobacteria bacterium]|nr:SDR family oxidoreductase [Acidobacteriota bacterium]
MRPVALITGASSGIGAEFARQLARKGYDLVLVARRAERLAELAASLPVQCEVLAADLAERGDVQRVAGRVRGEPRLELLVNNAGFGTKGRFWEAPLAEQQRMHALHVDATVELTHAALGGMVQRAKGAVINVASVAAFSRSQSNVSYCATKTWMVAFTEGLELELRGLGSAVQVQALCPGFTYSEFHDTMGVSRDRIPKGLWMKAEDVVADSLRGLDHRKLIVVPGWRYRLFVALFGRLPHSWRMAMQQRSPHTRGRV